jgi:hypothetical protein
VILLYMVYLVMRSFRTPKQLINKYILKYYQRLNMIQRARRTLVDDHPPGRGASPRTRPVEAVTAG